ncbi:MAG: HlyD family efflux transporter periplasmic adaptor subunit [Lachnospiraceae bacterium]|nr:HlyD family efflux transporter periplasmic adaptor subunit [Lachnospiraceae bacterium]
MRKKDKEIYEETDMIDLSEEQEGSKETPDVLKKKKKLPNWVIVPIIGGVVVVAVVVSQFTSKEQKTGGTVEVVEVARGDVKEIYNVSGTVDSEKKKVFYSPVNAPVSQLHAKVGQSVKAGDTLVTFDTSDLEKNNEKAQLDLQSAVNTNQSTREQADRSASEAAKAAADAQAASDAARAQVEQQIASVESQISAKSQQMAALEQNAQNEIAANQALQPQLDEWNAQKNANVDRISALYGEVDALRTQINDGNLSEEEKAALEAQIDEKSREISEKEGANTTLDAQIAQISSQMQTGSQQAYAQAQQEVQALQAQAEQLRASISVEQPSTSVPDTSLTSGQINNMEISENLAELAVLSSEELMAKARDGIKADFDGVISDVKTVEGGTAVAGGELFTLVSNQDVNVKLEIPASDFDKVEVGSKAVVKIGKYKYDGVVESIDKIAVPNAKGNPVIGANVKIQNPDENIYIGVAAKLTMTVAEEKDVLYLPNENVNTSTEGDFVYVVQNGVVKKKAVELGITSNSKVEIKSGLEEGDQVVSDTFGAVEEGMKVTKTTVVNSEEK